MTTTSTQPVEAAALPATPYLTEPHSLGDRFSATELYQALSGLYYRAHRRSPYSNNTSYFAREANRFFNKGWTRAIPRF